MSDRGDYRSFYVSMLDDPDFRDMPGDQFKLLFALRLTLGAAGIGVLRKLVLCEQMKLNEEELERGLEALEAPKPESRTGWIIRDKRRGIVWVVNALRFEPSLSPNNKKQKKFINNQLKPLSQNSTAVHAFWAAYGEWKAEKDPGNGLGNEAENEPDPPKPIGSGANAKPTPNDSHPNGQRMAIERESFHSSQATSDKRQETITSDKRPESGQPPPRDRFFANFYAKATAERRADIDRQLKQILRPEGLRVSKTLVVRANSPEHLNRALSDVLRGPPPRNTDRAIVVLFRKLEDAEKNGAGETPAEAAVHDAARQVQLEDRYHAAARNAGAAWATANLPEYDKINSHLEARYRGQTNSFAQVAKDAERDQKCAKAAGFPGFDTWLEQQEKPQQQPQVTA